MSEPAPQSPPPDVLASAPPEVQEALGGPPLMPPPQLARRIRPRPPRPSESKGAGAPASAAAERAENPLFDEPSADVEDAVQCIRTARRTFGEAALALESAVSAADRVSDLPADILATAARREGYDPTAAAKVAAEFAALLDKHKPRKKEQSSKGAEK